MVDRLFLEKERISKKTNRSLEQRKGFYGLFFYVFLFIGLISHEEL
jgi:hypothetical protein